MFDLAHDARVSIRGLLRRPTYPIVAVSILALGLSACIAVVTYVNAFYQPFPGVDADRLVRVFGTEDDETYQNISYLDFLDYAAPFTAAENTAFEGIAATQPYYLASVRLETMTEFCRLEAVSGEYFSVLGIRTTIGRGLTANDNRPGADPAAVISHEWWQRTFGGDASVLGRTIYLNYRPFTVVGVATPEFLGTMSDFRPNVWIPFTPFKDRYTRWANRSEDRDLPLVRLYGRLRPGVSQEQGLAALTATAAGLDETYPRQNGSRHLRLEASTWIDPRSRLDEWSTVRMMTAAAGGLLLLVCANVANLLLSVALRRRRETAVRAALGASPGRLVRQVLLENILLSSLAGSIALLLAGPLSFRLGAYFARPSVWGINVARQTSIDLSVVAFALLASIATGVVAGLLPAARVWRRDLLTTLRTTGDASISIPRRVWGWRVPGVRDLLVSAQVALCVVLLVVAGLVLRTLATAGNLDPGFSYTPLIEAQISTSSTDLEVTERDAFLRQLAERLAEEPWVRSAAVTDYPLLAPHPEAELVPEGGSEPVSLVLSNVIPGFFEALGIDLRKGRVFEETDTADGRDVAVVNEALARRLFAGENPLGRHLSWPEADRRFEIVGVVRDTKTQDFFAEPPPTVYFAYPQQGYGTTSALMVSVTGNPLLSVPRLHRWLRDFEPYLAIINVVTYKDIVRGFLYTHRMNAEMFSIVAFLGLALSVVGIWSVVSLAVSRRKREIAVRVAIGAERVDISRLILKKAFTSVTLGLILGLTLSYLLAGLIQSLLFGVEATDPLTLAAGAGVLVLATLSAAYLPARRAATVDPTVALRQE